MFDHLIFIGRFQPFHKGHEFVVREAFKRTNHLILLIGSANRPRTPKNPFTFDERKAMIEATFSDLQDKKLTCLPLDDTIYNDDLWLKFIQTAVASVTNPKDSIGIIGHTKDDSSYYLKLFPNWGFCEVVNFEQLSATPIRKAYFSGSIDRPNLPTASIAFLETFSTTEHYQKLKKENDHIIAYKAQFDKLPYPPIFVTCDALVVACGHLLVIRRDGEYGTGLLALAGGFLDADESLQACVMRELKEETGLDVEKLTPIQISTFDDPSRSARGRTITTVYHYQLDTLAPLKAGDDASEAFWLPLSELNASEFFEDHYGIVVKMLGIY